MAGDELEQLRGERARLAEQVRLLMRTEQRLYRTQRELEARVHMVGALNRLTLAASGAVNTADVLRFALDALLELYAYEQALGFARDSAGRLRVHAAGAARGAAAPVIDSGALVPFDLPEGSGPLAFAGAPPPGLEAFFARVSRLLPEVPASASHLVVPVRRRSGEVDAVLYARTLGTPVSHAERLSGPDDEPFLGLLAHELSTVLENTRLKRRSSKSEALIEAGFARASVGMALVDPDGRFQRVNPALAQLLGRGEDDLVGRRFVDVTHPDDVAVSQRVFLAALRGELSSLTFEKRFVDACGRIFWAQVTSTLLRADDGRPLLFFSQIEDVTERRNARDELERGEARLRSILENLPDAIFALREDRVVYANAAAARLLGEDQVAPLLGAGLAARVHAEDRPALGEALRSASRAGLGARELRFSSARGGERLAECAAMPIEFDGGPAVLLVAIDRSREARMRVQLEQAERLASLGTLAAGVAHEVNNPLTFVLLNLENLAGRLEGEPAELAESALDGVRRIQAIVKDLKTFSRADADRRATVDVNRVIATVLAMTAHETRYRARVTTELGDDLVVEADEGRLAQVFLNLVMNAAQSLPEGHVEQHAIHIRSRREDGHVVVEIVDSGEGIAAADLARVFEPFYSTKAPGVGTGLGLSICRNLVEGFGGQLVAESTPGRGSRFVVRLPAAGGAVAPEVVAPVAPPPAAAGLRRVLLVDDEPTLRRIVAELLDDEFQVVPCEGASAAQAVLARDTAFDAVLCDLMMPDMTGMDLHAWMLEHQPELARRTAFMSGGAFTPRASAFLAATKNPVIDKPFKDEDLRAALRRVIDGEAARP